MGAIPRDTEKDHQESLRTKRNHGRFKIDSEDGGRADERTKLEDGLEDTKSLARILLEHVTKSALDP